MNKLYLRCIFSIILTGISSLAALAQTITSFSPESGAAGTTVTITGTGFNTTPASNIVYFGPIQVAVTSSTVSSLQVTVPPTVGYNHISVTNLANNLTAYSAKRFNLEFPVTGEQSFGSGYELASGTEPYDVVAGDLDNDGRTDLVVINATGGTLSVYRNLTTTGISFSAKTDIPAGTDTRSVLLSDIDGDGKKDLIASSRTPGTVSIFRNISTSGNISFDPKVDIASTNAMSLAVGDLNQDGKPDLVSTGNGVSIFRNTSTLGNISFTTTSIGFPAASGVAIGDLSGDNIPDLLVIERSFGTPSIASVLKNITTTNIEFAPKIDFTLYENANGAAIADLDGDGLMDMAITTAVLTVFRNTSSGGVISMANKIDLATAVMPYAVAAGDVDGDGKPDLVSVRSGSANGSVSFFKNISTPGTLQFQPKVDYTTSTFTGSYGVALANLDNDGRPEVAVVNSQGSNPNKLVILRNISIPTPPSITSFSPVSALAQATITITGTGFNTTSANNKVTFGPVTAEVTASSATSLTVKVPAGAAYGPVEVLNTDVSLRGRSSTNFVPLFSPVKLKSVAADIETKVDYAASPLTTALAVSDIDGDGKVDVAVTNQSPALLTVFRNNSAPGAFSSSSFNPLVNFSTAGAPVFLTAADLDNDGKNEMITANGTGQNLSIFRNTSTPGSITASTFAAKADITTGGNTTVVAVSDLNVDGRADLLYLNSGTSTLFIAKNNSVPGTLTSGSFSSAVTFATGNGPAGIATGDLNGDGKPEVVVANAAGNSISVYNNLSVRSGISTSSLGAKVDFTTGSSPVSVAIGDLNGDGKPEIIVGNRTSRTVSVFRNISSSGSITSASFAAKKDFSTTDQIQSISITDINGDGKPDILSAMIGNGASLLQNTTANPTDILYDPVVYYLTVISPKVAAGADLDGDQKPDVIVATATGFSINRNNPNSKPVASTLPPTAAGINTAALAATVNDNGEATTVSFEYSASADMSASQTVPATTGATVNAGAGNTSATAALTGLQSGKLYFYRVKATNASGVTLGIVRDFVTLLPQPDFSAPAITYADTVKSFATGVAINPLQPVNTGGAVPPGVYLETTTIAGSGTSGYSNGIGPAAKFDDITNIAADGLGNLFVSDQASHTIRKVVVATGEVTTLAGSGTNGFADGTGTAASFYLPSGLATDGAGNLYVAEASNHRIRKIVIATGAVSTIAGGTFGVMSGIGTAAQFGSPWGITYNGAGVLYVADQDNNWIRRIDLATNTVIRELFSATLTNPVGMALDKKGFGYILDHTNTIRKANLATRAVTVLANAGTGAAFDTPYDIVSDGAGNLYVADSETHTIKKVSIATGTTTVLAGSAEGFADGIGTAARFDNPMGLAYDQGNLYVADDDNTRIRKISLTGYTISPELPAGLVFDNKTGIISGTPSIINPKTTYTITAYNTAGVSTSTIAISTATPSLSKNADLTSLTTNKGTLSPAFSADVTSYETAVSDTTRVITITALAADSTATVKINGQAITRGASAIVQLVTGVNTISALITAQDTTIKKTYNLSVTVPLPLVAQEMPVFSPVAGPIAFGTAVTITSAGADSIFYTTNGTDPLTNGILYTAPVTVSSAVSFKAAAKKSGKLVSSQATASYTQAVSSGLTGLTISNSPSSYTFNSNEMNYPISFTNPVTDFTITPVGQGVITVNDIAVISGTAAGPVALAPGIEKTINISHTETGKSARVYTIKATRAEAGQAVPDSTGSVTLASGTSQVLITSPTQPITVIVPAGTEKPSIDYSALIVGGTGTIPQTTVESNVANMAIPASVKVTSSDPSWNGVLAVPTITTYDLPPNTGEITTYGLTIEVGSPDVSLSFDKGIRLLLPGQAGKRAGFVHGGVFAEITRDGLTDSQAEADLLPANSAYKINVGLDLVIWTKAFSKFLTFTRTTDPDIALLAFDKHAISEDLLKASNTDLSKVISSLASPLPLLGPNGSAIGWTSDNAAVISPSGIVQRPVFGSGNKTVTLTATFKKGLITDTRSYTVTVVELPNAAPALAVIPGVSLCITPLSQTIALSGITAGPEASQSLTLKVSSSNPALFSSLTVSPPINGASLLTYALANGSSGNAIITVTMKDNGGIANGGVDTLVRTFNVQVNALPVARISSSETAPLSKGATATLSATGGTSYSWANASGIIGGQNTATLAVRPAVNTTYTVTVTNAAGCTSTQSVTVEVTDDYQALDKINIMTPNGDGVNDFLVIKNLDMYPDNILRVFDQAGRAIYTKESYKNDWAGTLNGSTLAEGTYYYVLDFARGKGKVKGFVSIVH